MASTGRWAVLCVVVLAACASTPTAVPATGPPLASATLPGMTSSQTVVDAAALTAGTTDPDAVAAALQGGGFRAGTERTYTGGGTRPFTRVVVRRLAFDGTTQAATFLGWLDGDGATALLDFTPVALDVPAGVVVKQHEPSGCCHQEPAVYLAAWTDGSDVLTVTASGLRATDGAMERLVDTLWKEL